MDSKDRLNIYNNIYKKSISNILYPNSLIGSNTIDKHIYSSIEDQSDNAKIIAKFIIDNTLYIDFNTFINKISEMVSELANEIKSNSAKLILVVDDIYSSSFWVSMLMYKYMLSEHLEYFDIISSIDDYILNLNAKRNDNYIFIVADDCLYSGNNIIKKISVSLDTYDKILNYANNNIYISVLPFVPYISSYAFNNISKTLNLTDTLDYMYYLKSSVIFPCLLDMCIQKNFNILKYDVVFFENKIKSMIIDYFNINDTTCLIYFDHRLTNIKSIQCIYNNGMSISSKRILSLNKNATPTSQILYYVFINNIKKIIDNFDYYIYYYDPDYQDVKYIIISDYKEALNATIKPKHFLKIDDRIKDLDPFVSRLKEINILDNSTDIQDLFYNKNKENKLIECEKLDERIYLPTWYKNITYYDNNIIKKGTLFDQLR